MKKMTVLLFLSLIIFYSCKSKTPQHVTNASIIQTIDDGRVTLGEEKYRKIIISGFNNVFDVIRDSKNDILILQLEPRTILKFSEYKFKEWIGITSEGKLTKKWTSPTLYYSANSPANSDFSEPHSFVLDPRFPENFFVVFYGRYITKNSNIIGKFDLNSGSLISSFGMIDELNFSRDFTPEFKSPKGRVFFHGIVNGIYDKFYNFYVSDYTNCSILKFDKNYNFIGWIGGKDDGSTTSGWTKDFNPTCSNSPGAFNRLHGLALDSKNNFYVADTWNNRVQKFNSSGVFEKQMNDFKGPIAIKIDSKDNLYVFEWSGNRLSKFNAKGETLWQLNDFTGGYGLQVYDNEFMVADTGNKRVVIYIRE